MTRKTILKLTTLLSCIILITAVAGCKDSESEKASKDARESLDKGNRLIKASTDDTELSDSEVKKIEQIPDDISESRLKQERQKIAMQVADRLSKAASEELFASLNSKIQALESTEINSEEDFENICNSLIDITSEIIELTKSSKSDVTTIHDTKLEAAVSELKKAEQAIRNAPTEDNRRSTLNSACSLSLSAIYMSQARSEHQKLILEDTNVHPILMAINTKVHDIRQANLDILEAKAAKPDKVLETLNKQLDDAKQSLQSTISKLNSSKSDFATLEQEYDVNKKKADEFRDMYLETLSKADQAEGEEKYKLEMEATIQRVGKDNMKQWAETWIKQGKDQEMEMLVNSSQNIIGGIHYETQAEMAKLQMDSIETQINFYETLAANTEGRISHLEAYINELLTSEETTTAIQTKIDQAQEIKDAAIADIKTQLEGLKAFESKHDTTVDAILDLYNKGVTNLEQYASQSRGFGEFDPENFTALANDDIARLNEADAELYNSAIGVLDNVRTLPELAETALDLSDEFLRKAQEAAEKNAPKQPEPEMAPASSSMSSEVIMDSEQTDEQPADDQTDATEETDQQ